MLKKSCFVLFTMLLMAATSGIRAEAPAPPAGQGMTAEDFFASLKFQKGKIELPRNIATLDLPDSFAYLSPEDTENVLVKAWGNPPGNQTLGMILPSGINPASQNAWGVVITYDEDGHVKDDDADNINYDNLLKEMQEGMEAANAERKKQGYDGLALLGWAEKPTYDKVNHKLYWAKELKADNAVEHTLNYNIRVLGRKGVLVLNAIAGMGQIETIKTEMPTILAATEFSKGNTYAEFDSSTDKTAEYGIAALVAGGVAAKLGLFGKLFALLLAFKKLIVVAVIALFAGIKQFFGGKKDKAN